MLGAEKPPSLGNIALKLLFQIQTVFEKSTFPPPLSCSCVVLKSISVRSFGRFQTLTAKEREREMGEIKT
jgi:hypothetical protein